MGFSPPHLKAGRGGLKPTLCKPATSEGSAQGSTINISKYLRHRHPQSIRDPLECLERDFLLATFDRRVISAMHVDVIRELVLTHSGGLPPRAQGLPYLDRYRVLRHDQTVWRAASPDSTPLKVDDL